MTKYIPSNDKSGTFHTKFFKICPEFFHFNEVFMFQSIVDDGADIQDSLPPDFAGIYQGKYFKGIFPHHSFTKIFFEIELDDLASDCLFPMKQASIDHNSRKIFRNCILKWNFEVTGDGTWGYFSIDCCLDPFKSMGIDLLCLGGQQHIKTGTYASVWSSKTIIIKYW